MVYRSGSLECQHRIIKFGKAGVCIFALKNHISSGSGLKCWPENPLAFYETS